MFTRVLDDVMKLPTSFTQFTVTSIGESAFGLVNVSGLVWLNRLASSWLLLMHLAAHGPFLAPVRS